MANDIGCSRRRGVDRYPRGQQPRHIKWRHVSIGREMRAIKLDEKPVALLLV